MRTRLQDEQFKYGTTGIGNVKLGLRAYSTTNACSGKIVVRLWKGCGKYDRKGNERKVYTRCKGARLR